MRSPLAGLLLVAMVVACQSLPEGGGGSRPRSDRITRVELEELPTFTARQAIQKLRPSWLRPRTSTIRAGSGVRHTATVFLDGMSRGGLSALDGMDIREIEEALEQVHQQFDETGKPARLFCDFSYITRKSWSRQRRVIGKAEHLTKGSNPRFIVTSLSVSDYPARDLISLK